MKTERRRSIDVSRYKPDSAVVNIQSRPTINSKSCY